MCVDLGHVSYDYDFFKGNIELFFTNDQSLLDEYYLIRELCYRNVKNGPKNFDGSQDEFDLLSDTLIVTYKGIVIGGARVVGNHNCPKMLLPIENESFRVTDVIPKSELGNNIYCEFGRLAVLDCFRGTKLLDKVVEDLITLSIAKGYKYLFTMCPLVQARCYKQALTRLKVDNSFNIFNFKMPEKSEDECGSLDMYLASLEFPKKWNGITYRAVH